MSATAGQGAARTGRDIAGVRAALDRIGAIADGASNVDEGLRTVLLASLSKVERGLEEAGAAGAPRERRGGFIPTRSGVRFWPLDPKVEEVRLADIAQGLSNICRYGGQTEPLFSVAQHATMMSFIVEEQARGAGMEPAEAARIGLAALHHDDPEAYLVDLPKPIKKHLPEYKIAEGNLAAVIEKALGFAPDEFEHPMVKRADDRIVVDEVAAFFPHEMDAIAAARPARLGIGIVAERPEVARAAWFNRHEQLMATARLVPAPTIGGRLNDQALSPEMERLAARPRMLPAATPVPQASASDEMAAIRAALNDLGEVAEDSSRMDTGLRLLLQATLSDMERGFEEAAGREMRDRMGEPARGRQGDWTVTHGGVRFWPMDPRASEVRLAAVAQGLANLCCYGGQTPEFYSVAQRATLVSEEVERQATRNGLPDAAAAHLALAALHHMDSQAYLIGLPAPLERHLPEYKAAASRLSAEIERAMGFARGDLAHPAIQRAADRLTVNEAAAFFPAELESAATAGPPRLNIRRINAQSPDAARAAWLGRHNALAARAGLYPQPGVAAGTTQASDLVPKPPLVSPPSEAGSILGTAVPEHQTESEEAPDWAPTP